MTNDSTPYRQQHPQIISAPLFIKERIGVWLHPQYHTFQAVFPNDDGQGEVINYDSAREAKEGIHAKNLERKNTQSLSLDVIWQERDHHESGTIKNINASTSKVTGIGKDVPGQVYPNVTWIAQTLAKLRKNEAERVVLQDLLRPYQIGTSRGWGRMKGSGPELLLALEVEHSQKLRWAQKSSEEATYGLVNLSAIASGEREKPRLVTKDEEPAVG